jgi:hypothetical protein
MPCRGEAVVKLCLCPLFGRVNYLQNNYTMEPSTACDRLLGTSARVLGLVAFVLTVVYAAHASKDLNATSKARIGS